MTPMLPSRHPRTSFLNENNSILFLGCYLFLFQYLTFGPFGLRCGPSWASLRSCWGILCGLQAPLGGCLGTILSILGPQKVRMFLFGSSSDHLGPSLRSPGSPRAPLGFILGHLGAILTTLRLYWGGLGVFLGPSMLKLRGRWWSPCPENLDIYIMYMACVYPIYGFVWVYIWSACTPMAHIASIWPLLAPIWPLYGPSVAPLWPLQCDAYPLPIAMPIYKSCMGHIRGNYDLYTRHA